jgi:hypothetical protein
LTRRIRGKKLDYVKVATLAKVDASRVSKFCDGNFKRLTPILRRVCMAVGTNPEAFLETKSTRVPVDLAADIDRITHGIPARARALRQILRIVRRNLLNDNQSGR